MSPVSAGVGGPPVPLRSVLVVAYPADERARLGRWLEEEGFEVMSCPGPREPTVCPQIHGRSCPLSQAADVVVIDTQTEGDLVGVGPPGWVLVDSYLARGSKVVAICDPVESLPVMSHAPVVMLSRPATHEGLAGAVRQAFRAPRPMG